MGDPLVSSALLQSQRNPEIVAIDDGSTDATEELVSRISSLHCLPNATFSGSARHAVFPPVHVAPEGSPTGFHSAISAESSVSPDKAFNIKAFASIHNPLYCLAISLHKRQCLIRWHHMEGLLTHRPMGGGYV